MSTPLARPNPPLKAGGIPGAISSQAEGPDEPGPGMAWMGGMERRGATRSSLPAMPQIEYQL